MVISSRHGRDALALAVLWVCAVELSAAPRYEVVDLGILPGYTYCWPRDINESGQIVGTCDNGAAGFIYRTVR